jgi:hypothetical protein
MFTYILDEFTLHIHEKFKGTLRLRNELIFMFVKKGKCVFYNVVIIDSGHVIFLSPAN